MSKKLLSILAILTLSLSACSLGINQVSENKMTDDNKNNNTSPVVEDEATGDEDELMTKKALSVDTEKSQVRWEGKKILVDSKHFGTVNIKSGTIGLIGNDLANVSIIMDMTTIENLDQSGVEMKERLEGHLKSEDFFNVAEFPEASFVSSEIVSLGNSSFMVKGDMTIKGITKPLEFEAEITEREPLAAKASIIIDRSEFDVRFGSGTFFENLGDNIISDEISFEISIVGTN
jgi:polyisoprenoid-binding protein YceI